MSLDNVSERMMGCFIGLVVGDAFGAPYEFFPRGKLIVQETFTEIVNSKLQIKKGEWTDDSSMALALADSLLSCGGFDPKDQMQRYRRWVFTDEGYCSSRATAFGFGQTFLHALWCSKKNDIPYPGSINPKRPGNGSLMRLAPIPIYFLSDLEQTINYAGLSSMVTHGHPESVYGARLFARILHQALKGREKAEILQQTPESDAPERIQAIANGAYLDKPMEEIDGTFFAAQSLEAAMWCFARTDSFKDAIRLAVALGGDTDSTAAVCGQVAGAYYGLSAIPEPWTTELVKRDEVFAVAERLCQAGCADK
ncbi:ADP-ribosyl-[dinitrogen reductase] hydrolase [Allochromatium warmingii]|uniref:ADP-ribosyl-[dinitrogen reductase] hydrolase n=1 Tax=Allochromatium warmingii TaxID=61595 RepID=A0A1H3FDR8_ALLWA|nr:ADP-ribosylglycohydrolase family protein [Allochromatium warmingii]SDX89070.1 ADP-ribosyl-[dinitrogen reductase] hydrolase [Allochromatium warmingii]